MLKKILRTLTIFILTIVLVIMAFPIQAQSPDDEEIMVRVWLPDALYPLDSRQVINNEFESFEEDSNISIDFRPKVYSSSTNPSYDFVKQLQLTQDVAPDAMPDLVLMRREDVSRAIQLNLVVPLDDKWPIALLDLPDSQLAFGTFNGRLYGLPYLIDVQHMIYAPEVVQSPLATTQDVLDADIELLFPANNTGDQIINNMLLLQYVAAGGVFADDAGNPALTETVVLELMQFYEEAVAKDLITDCQDNSANCPLNYTETRDYWTFINDSSNNVAMMEASFYLQRRTSRFTDLALAPIPTLDGNPIAMLDGWMWVMTTADPARQQESRRFINLAMDSDTMARIANSVDMLPSQENALRLLGDDSNFDVLRYIAGNAVFISDESRRGVAALALQTALTDVLQGSSAEEATQTALLSLVE